MGPHRVRDGSGSGTPARVRRDGKRMRAAVLWTLAVVGLVGLAACHEGAPFTVIRTGPVTTAEIAGSWDAVTMVFTDDAGPMDALAAGGGLILVLGSDQRVSGRLRAPGQGPGGTDLDEDMEGVWSYDPVNRILRFVQDADTFVGRASFDVSRREDGVVVASALLPAEEGSPAVEVTIEKR